jgi:hypothetical protein
MRNAITLEDAARVVSAAKNSGLSPEEWFIQRLEEKLAERPLRAPARLVFTTLRPAYRGRAPRRRNVRTRPARARAPSDDPSPEPEPPLDVLDAAVLALGWERV